MQYEGTLLLASNNFPKRCSKMSSESMISTMALDNVSAVVKLDKTILTLGSDLIENQGIEKVPVRHLVSNVPGILEVSLRKMGH